MDDFMREIIDMNEERFSTQGKRVAKLILQGQTVSEALASVSSSDLLREDLRPLLYYIQLVSLVRACRQLRLGILNTAQVEDLGVYLREHTGLEC
jgi:hypothetical protein